MFIHSPIDEDFKWLIPWHQYLGIRGNAGMNIYVLVTRAHTGGFLSGEPRWGTASLHTHLQFHQRLPNGVRIHTPISSRWELSPSRGPPYSLDSDFQFFWQFDLLKTQHFIALFESPSLLVQLSMLLAITVSEALICFFAVTHFSSRLQILSSLFLWVRRSWCRQTCCLSLWPLF